MLFGSARWRFHVDRRSGSSGSAVAMSFIGEGTRTTLVFSKLSLLHLPQPIVASVPVPFRVPAFYRDHLREFPLEMIFNIVYHTPDTVANASEEGEEGSQGDGLSIEVQMAWGGSSTYNFQVHWCSFFLRVGWSVQLVGRQAGGEPPRAGPPGISGHGFPFETVNGCTLFFF